MQTECLQNTGPASTENATSEQLDGTTLNESMSSAEDFPVSRTVSPGPYLVQQTKEICGQNTCGSFAKLSRDGLWVRMFRGFAQRMLDGSSEEYCGTWPASGTMRSGALFQPNNSGRRTCERECSLLPTPAARDEKDLSSTTAYLSQRKRHTPSIATVALGHGWKWFAVAELYEAAMGFPLGWSDVGSSNAETQSCRKWLNGSAEES